MNFHATQEQHSEMSMLTEERGTLLDNLNEDLAGELQAVSMYLQYSALLRGSHRKELRELFQAEIPDELRHAQLLADKIAVCGGIPTTSPRFVPRAANAYQMLRNIFDAESRTIADYIERVKQAEAVSEVGLKVDLENLIVDETRHKEEVEQILSGWNPDDFNFQE